MSLEGLPKYIDLTGEPSPYHIFTAHVGHDAALTLLGELNAYGFKIVEKSADERRPQARDARVG